MRNSILPWGDNVKTSTVQKGFRILLGAALLFAGVSHLTTKREEFVAQVPTWLPLPTDFVVVASGVVEIALGASLILLCKKKVLVGTTAAVFFVLIFPGNISQYVNQVDAFSLNTDRARFIRLFFQPVLVAWALWSSGAYKAYVNRHEVKALN